MKTVVLAATALVLTGGVAYAQGQQPPVPPPEQQQQQPPLPSAQQPTVSVSEADVQTFAEIYVKVEQTSNELRLEMNEAASPEEAQEIQARMQEAIVAAIEEHGWSVAQYNDVANALSNDPELRSEALDKINELSST